MIRVTENLRVIRDLLAGASADAGRSESSVKLLAVSKKQPVSAVLEAAAAGQRDFGENFVQEGLEKIAASGRNDLVWHFIGHLQTNKTRTVAAHFDWVHTIDRFKVAKRLSTQRPEEMGDLNVCLQVNIDDEPGKSGVHPDEVLSLAENVAALPRIRLRGLMCLPANRTDFEQQREPFRRLRELFEILKNQGIDVDTLSMGMTGDYAAAIHEGSTIVRIGTAIFGARPT
ncbi:MAG: YggS family pyridoxal phosphate-dependent enzyme [Woeseiaceae bacterium]